MDEPFSGPWTGGTLPAGTTTAGVREYARTEGWELVGEGARSVHEPRRWMWRTGEGEILLSEDHLVGVRCVEIRPASFAERLLADLGAEPLSELFDRARTATDPIERMRALRALTVHQVLVAQVLVDSCPDDPDRPGYAMVPDDPRFLEAFEDALDDRMLGPRRVAVKALAYSPWPGSREILRRRRDDLQRYAELIDRRLAAELPRLMKSGAAAD
jgi:hypothetical protein